MKKFKCPYCNDFETDSFVGLGRHTQSVHNLRMTMEIYNKLQEEKENQPISKETFDTQEEEQEVIKDTYFAEEKKVEKPWFGGHAPL